MIYYRTKEDVKKLASEFKSEFKQRSHIDQFIKLKHDVKELGILSFINKNSFWVGNGNSGRKDNSFSAKAEVMDFLINSNAFADTKGGMNLVKVYGKMAGGKITEVYALNYNNLIDPNDLT